jgi:hypothetical protein
MTETGPRRAFELELKIGADSRRDLCDFLTSFVTQLHMDQVTTGVSGGPSSGGSYSLSVDETITHDSYFAAIDQWLAEKSPTKDGTP